MQGREFHLQSGRASQVALVVKNLPGQCRRHRRCGFDPLVGLGRSPGEGNGYLLHWSCLESPMDRGAWRAIVHKVTELDMAEVT